MPFKGNKSDIPEKWALCDGSNGTPDLRNGEFLEGSASAGSRKSAGIPNLKGKVSVSYWNSWAPYGQSNDPFYKEDGSGQVQSTSAGWKQRNVFMDASRVSSVYRNDVTTVQPKSYTVQFIMKIKA